MITMQRTVHGVFGKLLSILLSFFFLIGNPYYLSQAFAQKNNADDAAPDPRLELLPFDPIPDPVFDPIAPLPPVSGTTAGYLGGNFSVNESGSALYTMNLAVPPGTAGLAPDLNLVYSSSGLNTVLGTGWSLEGLSAITRCTPTIAQDGFIGTVNFDDNDRFCLDGQRLISISGDYGGDGTEYRTENESFSQIFSYGSAGNGPAEWLVKQKNGLHYHYGKTADARVEAEGRTDVLLWQVNKVEDSLGNYFAVHYHEDTSIGESYPTRIDYTGNDSHNLTPYNSVRLEYETRPDVAPRFIGGSMVKNTQRLKKIRMFTDEALAWEFLLDYQQSTLAKRSQLMQVTECGASGACLPATTFDWQAEQVSYGVNERWLHATWHDGHHQLHWVSNGSGSVYGQLLDINGDGRLDRVTGMHFTTGQQGLWVALNNGSGFSAQQNWWPHGNAGNQSLPETRYEHGVTFTLRDMNGDGLPDRLGHYNYQTGQAGFWVALNTGNGFGPNVLWRYSSLHSGHHLPHWISNGSGSTYGELLDMNGDSLPDRVAFLHSQTGQQGMWVSFNTGSGFEAEQNWWPHGTAGNQNLSETRTSHGVTFSLLDMNGDGLPDKLGNYNYQTNTPGLWVAINNGSGFGPQQRWWNGANSLENQPVWASDSGTGIFTHLQDMNGDGRPDRVDEYHNGESGVWIAINTGSGFLDKEKWFDVANNGYNRPVYQDSGSGHIRAHFLDITGDGFPERIAGIHSITSASGLWVAVNNGTGFEPEQNWWPHGTTGNAHLPEKRNEHGTYFAHRDMDGDGILDRVGSYNYQTNTPGLWVSKGQASPGLLTSITNGHGAVTNIFYTSLAKGEKYEKDHDANYPIVDLQGPMYVVSHYETDDGIGGVAQMSYSYRGLKIGLLGRGFCGFREVTTRNETTGTETTTFYRQDHPFKSFPFKTETRLSDGTLVKGSEDTWEVTNYPHGGYFPHITQTLEEDYEIDGSFINSTTTDKSYDEFGNTEEITVTQADGHSSTTINTYENDTANWFLGRLTRAEVTSVVPGEPPVTKISEFSYDSSSGLLTTETTEPEVALWLKKEYTHDQYGNITKSTTSGAEIAPRLQVTLYDTRGQFAVESINPLGHSETKIYDPRHGSVTSLTGPNGLTTSWEYDDFGRQAHEFRADGTETRTVRYLVSNEGPANAVYYERSDSSGAAPSITYYDLLDRNVRSETIGFGGQNIFVDSEYNNRGELVRKSDPYFEGDTPFWTVTQYDDLGRVTHVTAPGNRLSTTDYHGFTTTVSNPLGQRNTRVVNSLGKLVESRDNGDAVVNFRYDSAGNLIRMTDPAGNVTTMVYDIRGNKIKMTDPNSRTVVYHYDALGQLLSQTDAMGQAANFFYDDLGRMVSRDEPEGMSSWVYDTKPMGVGKLSSVTSPGNSHAESYHYDDLGRLVETETNIAEENYRTTTHYDQYGRVAIVVYPSGFATTNNYSDLGFLDSVSNTHNEEIYWETNQVNAQGQLEAISLGNGHITTKTYDTATGFVENITTPGVQDLAFRFDAIGNVLQRQDLSINNTENFSYDNLNRLTSTSVVGGDSTEITYDILGNITSMTGVGTYTYGQGAGPHAVTSISGPKANHYTYDGNGNRIADNFGTITYSSFNKPTFIEKGNTALEFFYGATRSRYAQITSEKGAIEKTKIYIGGIFEKERGESGEKEVHYIRGGSSTVAIFTRETDRDDKLQYLHKDHLGSIQSISDELGDVVEILSFDAWGNRRNADWSRATAAIVSEIDRGFTGHEQLDSVGLIHMNGRVYDPVIGRFLSPDPNVQAPENSQSLNRYSYVLNNPLSFTDPSGFFFKRLFKSIAKFIRNHLATIVAVAVIYYAGPWASGVAANIAGTSNTIAAGITQAAIQGSLASAASTAVSGGSIKDVLKSGVRGGVISLARGGIFGGIGAALEHQSVFGSALHLQKIIAHGTGGGLLELASGGKFRHGFVSSAFLELASPAIGKIPLKDLRTATSAAVGGTAAQIGGGKFSNGAITGAFANLHNHEAEKGAARHVYFGAQTKTSIPQRVLNYFFGNPDVPIQFQGIGGGIMVSSSNLLLDSALFFRPGPGRYMFHPDSDLDIGIYGELIFGKDLGIGHVSISTGFGDGSIKDQAGRSSGVETQILTYGAAVNLDFDTNAVTGAAVHLGAGFTAGTNVNFTGTCSLRHLKCFGLNE